MVLACKVTPDMFDKVLELAQKYDSNKSRIQAIALEYALIKHKDNFERFLAENPRRLRRGVCKTVYDLL